MFRLLPAAALLLALSSLALLPGALMPAALAATLTPDQARDVLALLGTADLKGRQVPRFVELVQVLNTIAEPTPAAPAPEAAPAAPPVPAAPKTP